MRYLTALPLLLLPLPAQAQNFGNIPPHSVLGNADASASKPAAPMDFDTLFGNGVTAAFPSSFPGSVPINMMSVVVGGPTGAPAQIPAGVAQGIVSSVTVPSSYTTSPWPNTAISGYINSGNTNNAGSVVALFGSAGQTANGASIFGGNITAGNCGLNCALGAGFDGGGWQALELDVNVSKKGTAAPIGQALGLVIRGGSFINPLNGSYAMAVRELGCVGCTVSDKTGMIPWDYGLIFDNGAVTNAVVINQITPASNSASQFLTFHSKSSGGTDLYTQLQQDATGILKIQPTGAGGVSLVTSKLSAPSLPTSAGAGGVAVCVDSAGLLYKKAACP